MTEVKKSCIECPSFLDSSQAANKYGRNIGTAVCQRYGTVLTAPRSENVDRERHTRKLREEVASKCPSYGEAPTGTLGYNMEVMLPDPTLRVDTSGTQNASMISTCLQCKNFVSEEETAEQTGYTAALCGARGKLLLQTRLALEARHCEFRTFGPNLNDLGGLHFIPEYSADFANNTVNAVAAFFNAKKSAFVDPSEYPTDKEVTDDDKAGGIRAWRKFDDPDGSGNSVHFPVYRRDFFDEKEQQLIPVTGSDEHPELYVDHFGGMFGLGVAWLELDETPVFWGQPGVGKTELLRYAAWIMQVPFRRISFMASSEVEDVIGTKEFSAEKGTYFRPGRLPQAWVRPGVLCLDEPNVPKDPAIWHAIRPLTDNSKQLVIDQNDGEPLERNTDCYMGMAMNPAWDVRNAGVLEMADADTNRLFHTYIEMPPEPLEKEIIQSYVRLDGWELSAEQLNSLMGTAKDIRALSAEDSISVTWALRQQIKVARALRWFRPATAYRKAIGDFLEPEQQQILLDQVRSNWKEQ